MRKIHRQVNREPNGFCASIFSLAGIDPVSRKIKFSVLDEMARNVKPISRPALNKTHKEKDIALAEKYLKTDFQQVLFTKEVGATLDSPDG